MVPIRQIDIIGYTLPYSPPVLQIPIHVILTPIIRFIPIITYSLTKDGKPITHISLRPKRDRTELSGVSCYCPRCDFPFSNREKLKEHFKNTHIQRDVTKLVHELNTKDKS